MARKLKTYQTSLGFYDQAIAAPSMKAALEAWGAESNLFHQGVAKETSDPAIVAATMAKPGVVLRRPVGSDGPFAEHADLPTDLAGPVHDRPGKRRAKTAKQPSRKIDDAKARNAALAFEKEQERRERQRRKEEAARAKERERREKAVAKAEAALDKARQEHEAHAEALETERAALEERAQAEQARWEKQQQKLKDALRRARQ
ncbi:cell envelope biogenesis protein TolA [Bradyrhizobium diazoefficiens]|nr:cell envelope biogenesis protein TolA [Bradyrhizobium diazoefficiens]QQN61464.1 cell envelope biogenesis protein TolA [Bradyrhizobium diazoefficiens]